MNAVASAVAFGVSFIAFMFGFLGVCQILDKFDSDVSSIMLFSLFFAVFALTELSYADVLPILEFSRRKATFWFETTICSIFFRILSLWNPPNKSPWYLLVFGALTVNSLCFIETVGAKRTFGVLDAVLSRIWNFGFSQDKIYWKVICCLIVIAVKAFSDFRGRRREDRGFFGLKEEFEELNGKYNMIVEQIVATGLSPISVGLFIKGLQEENVYLKTVWAELGTVTRNLRIAETCCKSLDKDKSTLLVQKATLNDQLRVTTEDLVKLSEKNLALENILSKVQNELEIRCAMEETYSLKLQELSMSLEDLRKKDAIRKDDGRRVVRELKDQILCTREESRMQLNLVHDLYGLILREASINANNSSNNADETLP